jgi:hypothetical protein
MEIPPKGGILSYGDLGLVMSEEALRKAVQPLRKRYQELFRQEIAHTVTSPAEVEDELRHLQTVMRR